MRRLFPFFLLIASLSGLRAQVACFNLVPASDTIICLGSSISVSSCVVCSPICPSIRYDWGDGSVNGLTNHTYSSTGTFKVTQYLNSTTVTDPNDTTSRYVRVVSNATQPQFTVGTCVGLLARVTITDTNYERFVIDWGDASGTTIVLATDPPATHVYPNNTPRTINVTGEFLNVACTNNATANITPFAALTTPQLIELEVLTRSTTNGQIELDFQAAAPFTHRIDHRVTPAAFAPLDTVTTAVTPLTYAHAGLNTQSAVNCYRVAQIDACSNEVLSPEICTIDITTATALDLQNQLGWNGYLGPSLNQYILEKNSATLTTTAGTTYLDNPVRCGETNQYQLIAELSLPSPVRSISAPRSLTTISSTIPGDIAQPHVTITSGRADLTWTTSPVAAQFYTVWRSTGGGYGTIGTTPYGDTTFTDASFDAGSGSACYKVTYTDSCGNVSGLAAALPACPVFLSGSVAVASADRILDWSNYATYPSGLLHYELEWLDETGGIFLTQNMGVGTSYLDNMSFSNQQVIRYRIRSIATGAEPDSYSNIVRLRQQQKLLIPNAFTPNGDGLNDVFLPEGLFIEGYELLIFNRWGQQLFTSSDILEGWDGTFSGNPSPPGVYTYRIDATDQSGFNFIEQGTFTLLRK